ncbi:PREDICTED: protein SRC2-like isoform X2 [Lupinus angustifolius]|uniref:protein SRC2-like isoform X2 n=1 Tax=Lupinus angustifolius TaxID=3871 RepID=UPI00092F4116|nr:PREDICTED: protein SRC2-like isoform X2 [Lupinus angustifolius]
MASRYELELKIASARNLKNVNWRHGPNKPYAVVWIDPSNKFSTRVDESGDTEANWDQTLLLSLPQGPIEDFTLFIDIVHAGSEEDTKRLIGSARLKLADVIDDGGIGERVNRTLTLKRPSGRPHGKVDVRVVLINKSYHAPGEYYAPPYGVPPSSGYPYGGGYNAPPQTGSYGAPYGGYNSAPQTASYGEGGYGYGAGAGAVGEKKSKFGGMGTGLAVGALAGVVGGVALVEGAEYVEDKIADDAAEKVEEDLGYDDDGGDFDGGDF